MLSSLLPLLLACAPETEDSVLSFPGQPGLYELSFDHDGEPRSSVVYVPESASPGSPLLLNFHGFGGTGRAHLLEADLRELAEREGVVLAYPQGSDLEGSSHWNAALPGPDNKSSADDQGFVRALVDNIQAEHGVDSERVYATGYSNGGMLSYALACHGQGLVAAVVAVSGAFINQEEGCSPDLPVPVMVVHGTADSVLPYQGSAETLSVAETLAFWVDHNETSPTPEESSTQDGDTRIETLSYGQGRGGSAVVHHRVIGGGHTWFEVSNEGEEFHQVLWDFVSPHSLESLR